MMRLPSRRKCLPIREAALAALLSGVLAAGAAQTLELAIAHDDVGLDPVRHHDRVSLQLQESVFARLLTYDANAQTLTLVPQAAARMPSVSADGKVYTITLSPGQCFALPAALGHRTREVTAADVAFSVQRMIDSNSASPERGLWVEAVARIEVVDNTTIAFHLKAADSDFPYLLALPSASIIAAESLAAHAEQPVGSGAYEVASWERGKRLTLAARQPPRDAPCAVASPDAGPALKRIHLNVVADERRRLEMFERGELDLMERMSAPLQATTVPQGKLAPALARRGIRLDLSAEPEIIYYYLNPSDPTTAGSAPARRALREAIIRSYDIDAEIRELRNGLAVAGQAPVPAGMAGRDPGYRSALTYDVRRANQLLDEHGYQRAQDGWRRNPDGTPLTVVFSSEPLPVVAPYLALRRAGLAQIGVRMVVREQSFEENLRSAARCDLAFWGAAWRAIVPTAAYFLRTLHSRRIGAENMTCFRSAAFDSALDAAIRMPPSALRDAAFTALLRSIESEAIWQLGVQRLVPTLLGPRVRDGRRHPMLYAPWHTLTLHSPAAGTAP
jgi:oligopeptide transport system substrate-binding protein